MVRIHPDPPGESRVRLDFCESVTQARINGKVESDPIFRATKHGEARGAVAQLGERLLCKQEVIGSIPFSSTSQNAECRSKHQRLLLIFGSDRKHRLLFKKTEEVKRT